MSLFLYICRRLALGILTCLLVAAFLVVGVRFIPGDPATLIASQQQGGGPTSGEYVGFIRAELGLDEPVWQQLWNFLWNAVHGDLGTDFVTQTSVGSEIMRVLPDTLILTAVAVALALIVGVPLGVIASRWPESPFDRLLGGTSAVMISGLPYVFGFILMIIFAVHLQWLPAFGAGSLSEPGDYLRHLLLPAVTLAVPWWGYLMRLVRGSMLEVMGSNYIGAARAAGLTERLVFYKYGLKNALIPVVALYGMMLGYTLGGTVYIEVIFNRPGLGTLTLSAVESQNWTVVRAAALVYAAVFVFGSLAADISYRFLDPRIRVERSEAVPS